MLKTLQLPYHPKRKHDYINYQHDDISLAEQIEMPVQVEYHKYITKFYKVNGIELPPCSVLSTIGVNYLWKRIEVLKQGDLILVGDKLEPVESYEVREFTSPQAYNFYETELNYYYHNEILIHPIWKK